MCDLIFEWVSGPVLISMSTSTIRKGIIIILKQRRRF